jgi:hypothetical protein
MSTPQPCSAAAGDSVAADRGLSPAALAFRAVHAAIAVGFLAGIGYVWACALTGRRGPWLRVVLAALAGEGLVVVANRGDCPLGGLQARLGDPVPLFELVLSQRAARRAVPALGAVTVAGAALLLRGSRGRQQLGDGRPGRRRG